MIATITRQQVGTVERALQIFMKLGLVEPFAERGFVHEQHRAFNRSVLYRGERKRRARRALQEQAALPEAVADKCPPYAADICPPERELEIEKEIDIELEIKREGEGEIKPGQTTRAPFGRYKNVFLSEKELAELQTELPSKWEYYIDRLSGYIASSGKKYKNHAATIRRWAADDEAKKAPKQKIPDYSYREGESL